MFGFSLYFRTCQFWTRLKKSLPYLRVTFAQRNHLWIFLGIKGKTVPKLEARMALAVAVILRFNMALHPEMGS